MIKDCIHADQTPNRNPEETWRARFHTCEHRKVWNIQTMTRGTKEGPEEQSDEMNTVGGRAYGSGLCGADRVTASTSLGEKNLQGVAAHH